VQVRALFCHRVKSDILLSDGESKNACELHEDYFEEYRQMTDEEKDALVERHKDVGVRDIKLRRDTPRAKVQDVANIVRNMQLLVRSLKFQIFVRWLTWASVDRS
jgi:hypothetical protein